MAYILEWQADLDPDPLACLIRHIRVFRNAGAVKAFLRSRAFRRIAGDEIRLQHRARELRPEAVITTVAAALAWDPAANRLPPPQVDSAWAEVLTIMSLRGHLLERFTAELCTAERLQLLSGQQTQTLLAQLREMLAPKA